MTFALPMCSEGGINRLAESAKLPRERHRLDREMSLVGLTAPPDTVRDVKHMIPPPPHVAPKALG